MQHHEEEDMMQLESLVLYTERGHFHSNTNRGVHVLITICDQNTHMHMMHVLGKPSANEVGCFFIRAWISNVCFLSYCRAQLRLLWV